MEPKSKTPTKLVGSVEWFSKNCFQINILKYKRTNRIQLLRFLTLLDQKSSDSLKAIIITSNIWNMKHKSISRDTLGLLTYACILQQCPTVSGISAIHQHLFGHPLKKKNRKRNHNRDLYFLVLCLHSVFSVAIMVKKMNIIMHESFFKGMPAKSRKKDKLLRPLPQMYN